jgi:hypothetical protein
MHEAEKSNRQWPKDWSHCEDGKMPDNSKQMIEIAQEISFRQQSRAARIKRQLAQLEAQKAKLEVEWHAANLAHERLGRFVPIRGGNLQCARCWIEHETISDLRSIGGGSGRTDIFRCNTCDETFALPI